MRRISDARLAMLGVLMDGPCTVPMLMEKTQQSYKKCHALVYDMSIAGHVDAKQLQDIKHAGSRTIYAITRKGRRALAADGVDTDDIVRQAIATQPNSVWSI